MAGVLTTTGLLNNEQLKLTPLHGAVMLPEKGNDVSEENFLAAVKANEAARMEQWNKLAEQAPAKPAAAPARLTAVAKRVRLAGQSDRLAAAPPEVSHLPPQK